MLPGLDFQGKIKVNDTRHVRGVLYRRNRKEGTQVSLAFRQVRKLIDARNKTEKHSVIRQNCRVEPRLSYHCTGERRNKGKVREYMFII